MTWAGAVALAIALVVGVLALALRPRHVSTLEYYLAGRRVGVLANACAICGDYFSAASFLGVAAAVYASGLDGAWYATGFAAGFVPVLLFIAAPLRRFGEFSIPDFLGRRLESEAVRVTAVGVVQVVILCYLVPQAVGSGITWELLTGVGLAGMSPYTTGVVIASTAVAAGVMIGGMRGATWTQSVQFLFLLSVLLWLAAIVVSSGLGYAGALGGAAAEPLSTPTVGQDGWVLDIRQNVHLGDEPARFDQPGARYTPFGKLALVVTLLLGTAGLPHVMNRYFTCPTGRAARMTTVWVLGLAGVFYTLAVFLGTAARAVLPTATAPWLTQLTTDGVLRVPEYALLALGRVYAGRLGLGLIAFGALVAVLSTIAGLLLAAAASWGHDVYERHVNQSATQQQAVRAGQLTVAVVAVLAALLALALRPQQLAGLFPSLVATMVTWAFAVAGSSVTPVFLLAIWWRRTTAAGAVLGMVVGAVAAAVLIAAGLAGAAAAPGGSVFLTPTLIAAPAATAVCVGVSLRTAAPSGLAGIWLRLHGTAADRQAERLTRLMLGEQQARRSVRP